MSYPIDTIGDVAPALVGERAPVPMSTKLAIAGVVAGALLYLSPEFRRWEERLSSAQKVGIALGGAGLFLAVMQIAMMKDRERTMISFQRDPPQPPPPTPPTPTEPT